MKPAWSLHPLLRTAASTAFRPAVPGVLAAAPRMVVRFVAAGHSGFSIMVLIQIHSSLGPRSKIRLRRCNYTRVKSTGDNSGISEMRLGKLRGFVSAGCGRGLITVQTLGSGPLDRSRLSAAPNTKILSDAKQPASARLAAPALTGRSG